MAKYNSKYTTGASVDAALDAALDADKRLNGIGVDCADNSVAETSCRKGYINTSGKEYLADSSNYRISPLIELKKGEIFKADLFVASVSCAIAVYNSDNDYTPIEVGNGSLKNYSYKAEEDCKISFVQRKSNFPVEYSIFSFGSMEELETNASNFNEFLHVEGINTFTRIVDWNKVQISNSGAKTSSSQWKTTDPILLKKGTMIVVNTQDSGSGLYKIFTTNEQGTNIEGVAGTEISTANKWQTYRYVAKEDTYVIAQVWGSNSIPYGTASVISAFIDQVGTENSTNLVESNALYLAANRLNGFSICFKEPYSKTPNIDTINGVLEMPEFTLAYNNTTLHTDAQNVSIKGNVTTSYNYLLIDYKTGVLRTISFTESKTNDEIVIGSFVTRSSREYTKFYHAELPFDYTINGGSAVELNDEKNTTLYFKQIQRSYRGDNTSSKTRKPLVLLHFSDIHGGGDNLNRVLFYYNYYSTYINDVLCSGDMTENAYNQTDYDWWQSIGAGNVLTCIGNHDVAHFENGTYDWARYTGSQAYARYFAPYISKWQATHDGDTSHCYYYKDYSEQKLRMVVLDSMAVDDAQKAWLTSTLSSAKESGYSVICVAHHMAGNIVKENCSFGNQFYAPSDFRSSQFVSIVDEFINDGGSFVCWLFGHTHCDYFGVIEGHTNQLSVTISTANGTTNQSRFDDIERTSGTKTFDLFNIVSIDTYNSVLSIKRVGADVDSHMVHIGSIAYDYKNHKVIWND